MTKTVPFNVANSRHVPSSGHNDVALFNDVAYDAEETQK